MILKRHITTTAAIKKHLAIVNNENVQNRTKKQHKQTTVASYYVTVAFDLIGLCESEDLHPKPDPLIEYPYRLMMNFQADLIDPVDNSAVYKPMHALSNQTGKIVQLLYYRNYCVYFATRFLNNDNDMNHIGP